MKDEWNSQLAGAWGVHYSMESSSDPIWTVTAQARGSVILHQATLAEPGFFIATRGFAQQKM